MIGSTSLCVVSSVVLLRHYKETLCLCILWRGASSITWRRRRSFNRPESWRQQRLETTCSVRSVLQLSVKERAEDSRHVLALYEGAETGDGETNSSYLCVCCASTYVLSVALDLILWHQRSTNDYWVNSCAELLNMLPSWNENLTPCMLTVSEGGFCPRAPGATTFAVWRSALDKWHIVWKLLHSLYFSQTKLDVRFLCHRPQRLIQERVLIMCYLVMTKKGERQQYISTTCLWFSLVYARSECCFVKGKNYQGYDCNQRRRRTVTSLFWVRFFAYQLFQLGDTELMLKLLI